MSRYGLTVRWSLHGTTSGVSEQLRDHVARAVTANEAELPDVEETLWTLREGGSFGVTHVFRSAAARAEAVRRIRSQGSPITTILGHSADALEEFEVLAIVRSGGR